MILIRQRHKEKRVIGNRQWAIGKKYATSVVLPYCLLPFFVSLTLFGCTKPVPPKQSIDFVAKLKTCLPEYKKNSINNTDNVLKIKNVMSDYQGTTLSISIAASDTPLNFNFPIYVYSKGRWLINPDDVNGKDGDKGRAYLIDANCTQYKLKDRGSSKDIDKNGRLKLKAGQTYEINIRFTPLPPNTQAFLLMYGERVILFNR